MHRLFHRVLRKVAALICLPDQAMSGRRVFRVSLHNRARGFKSVAKSGLEVQQHETHLLLLHTVWELLPDNLGYGFKSRYRDPTGIRSLDSGCPTEDHRYSRKVKMSWIGSDVFSIPYRRCQTLRKVTNAFRQKRSPKRQEERRTLPQ